MSEEARLKPPQIQEKEGEIENANSPVVVEPKSPLDKIGPSGLSRRAIEKMKLAEIDKPAFISWGEWVGPKKLSPRIQFIAHLAALGKTGKQICMTTGMSQPRVSILMNSPIVVEEISRIREIEFHAAGLSDGLKRLAPQAMREYESVLMDASGSKRALTVAKHLIELEVGKPKQQVEHTGSLMASFYDMAKILSEAEEGKKKLEKDVKSEALDVTESSKKVETKSALDPEEDIGELADELFKPSVSENPDFMKELDP